MRALLLYASACLAVAAAAPAWNGSKPHIVVFVVDDLGWYNVGWHNPDMITPFSDQLVKEGVELDRQYVFHYCAPTRSSIMSGRLPYHVNQVILTNWAKDWDMPAEMTALPAKLKQAGYATHMVGKWHVGFQNVGQTPHGRGFDTFFGFFDGAEDHWTQGSCIDPTCNEPSNSSSFVLPLRKAGYDRNSVDLWCTDRPCDPSLFGKFFRMGSNGQVVGDEAHYGDHMFTNEAIHLIEAHDPSVPLFFYIAFQNNHEPLEAPDRYIEMYPAEWRQDRRWYAGMTTYWDECIGNVTQTLKDKGMYSNTLIVLTTDNGGPTYWTAPKQLDEQYLHGGGANNYPLKGSKASNWEGGVRGAAFVSGGFLPPKLRGTKLDEYIHIADWYSTFCFLAGVEPGDPKTRGTRSDGSTFRLPPIDSLNMWPVLTGDAPTSPRTEIPLAVYDPLFNSSALIMGKYKLLVGKQPLSYHQGPAFPNGTEPYGKDRGPIQDCGSTDRPLDGCLYDILKDPGESFDLATELPEVVQRMRRRLAELRDDMLDQTEVVKDFDIYHVPQQFVDMLRRNDGVVGPWLPLPGEEELVV